MTRAPLDPVVASWSPTLDPATRRAFSAAWVARGTADFRDAVAELVAAAERAVDAELCRRLELAISDGFDVRHLLEPSALEAAREAVAVECRAGEEPIAVDRRAIAALTANEFLALLRQGGCD